MKLNRAIIYFLSFTAMSLFMFSCDIESLVDDLNPCVDECHDGSYAESLLGGICNDDCDCDGLRTCNLNTGYCEGTARDCETYDFAVCEEAGETVNMCLEGCMDMYASNYDSNAFFDDGSCEYVATSDCIDPCYVFDEAPTNNTCTTDCDCDGMRTCSWDGFCERTSRNCSTMDETSCEVDPCN